MLCYFDDSDMSRPRLTQDVNLQITAIKTASAGSSSARNHEQSWNSEFLPVLMSADIEKAQQQLHFSLCPVLIFYKLASLFLFPLYASFSSSPLSHPYFLSPVSLFLPSLLFLPFSSFSSSPASLCVLVSKFPSPLTPASLPPLSLSPQ